MSSYSLSLFGGFDLRDYQGAAITIRSKKGRCLLAYLALAQGQQKSCDELAALLWGDRGDTQAAPEPGALPPARADPGTNSGRLYFGGGERGAPNRQARRQFLAHGTILARRRGNFQAWPQNSLSFEGRRDTSWRRATTLFGCIIDPEPRPIILESGPEHRREVDGA